MSDLSYLKSEVVKANTINPDLYNQYDVKRGLRNKDGSGVLAGLSGISGVVGSKLVDGDMIPMEGDLKYRGIPLAALLDKIGRQSRYQFEQSVFLLLVGRLPNATELSDFQAYMAKERVLPEAVITHAVKGVPGRDMMNKLQLCLSALYSYDSDADSIDPYDNFLKSVSIIAKMPLIVAYSYLQAFKPGARFVAPELDMSQAEAFLYCLNEGQKANELDAQIMDLCLLLHAEHGGGNNSTFTAHVVTSSAADIYSVIAACVASLKGPLHGAANSKVMEMMSDIKSHVSNWENKDEVCAYLNKILKGEAHDGSGKIYGLGHAVYTKSDPRATEILKVATSLAKSKGREKELNLYLLLEKEAPRMFQEFKGSNKVIAPNVDFFSGFVYDCLGLPQPLYTAMFAMARAAGWCAHRIEETLSGKRIIRPGYKFIG